jgi:hypothetical protein
MLSVPLPFYAETATDAAAACVRHYDLRPGTPVEVWPSTRWDAVSTTYPERGYYCESCGADVGCVSYVSPIGGQGVERTFCPAHMPLTAAFN